jgi:hypothetical protein
MRPPEKRIGPSLPAGTDSAPSDATTSSLLEVADELTQLQRRLVQECVNAGLAATWERRAAMWEWARPRPGEHLGERSPAQARAKWHELTAIADACRARAALSRQHEGIDPDIDEALGVVVA